MSRKKEPKTARNVAFIVTAFVLAIVLVGAGILYNFLGSGRGGAGLVGASSQVQVDSGVASLTAGSGAAAQSADPNAGLTRATDFAVYDADGNLVNLSDYFGKPIVLNFWASWCPPCKSEMPEFETVYKELGETVQFMMVDLVDGSRETTELGAAHIEEQGYTFPVFYDSDQDAAKKYGITSIPTTVFINADGYIVTSARGAITELTLRQGIGMAVG